MAKANKNIFDALRETMEYTFVTKSGLTHTVTISQLTVGDIAELGALEGNDSDFELIARSIGGSSDEARTMPIALVPGLMEAIIDFNDMRDVYEASQA